MKKNTTVTNNTAADFVCPGFPMRYGYSCNDCRYLSRTDMNKYGEYYCGYFRKYMDASDNACSHLDKR